MLNFFRQRWWINSILSEGWLVRRRNKLGEYDITTQRIFFCRERAVALSTSLFPFNPSVVAGLQLEAAIYSVTRGHMNHFGAPPSSFIRKKAILVPFQRPTSIIVLCVLKLFSRSNFHGMNEDPSRAGGCSTPDVYCISIMCKKFQMLYWPPLSNDRCVEPLRPGKDNEDGVHLGHVSKRGIGSFDRELLPGSGEFRSKCFHYISLEHTMFLNLGGTYPPRGPEILQRGHRWKSSWRGDPWQAVGGTQEKISDVRK